MNEIKYVCYRIKNHSQSETKSGHIFEWLLSNLSACHNPLNWLFNNRINRVLPTQRTESAWSCEGIESQYKIKKYADSITSVYTSVLGAVRLGNKYIVVVLVCQYSVVCSKHQPSAIHEIKNTLNGVTSRVRFN